MSVLIQIHLDYHVSGLIHHVSGVIHPFSGFNSYIFEIPNYETSRKLALIRISVYFSDSIYQQIPTNCARHFKDNTFEKNKVWMKRG